jgi:hypothetical protein
MRTQPEDKYLSLASNATEKTALLWPKIATFFFVRTSHKFTTHFSRPKEQNWWLTQKKRTSMKFLCRSCKFYRIQSSHLR